MAGKMQVMDFLPCLLDVALDAHLRQKAYRDVDALRAAGDTSCFPGFLAPVPLRDLWIPLFRYYHRVFLL